MLLKSKAVKAEDLLNVEASTKSVFGEKEEVSKYSRKSKLSRSFIVKC